MHPMFAQQFIETDADDLLDADEAIGRLGLLGCGLGRRCGCRRR